MSEFLIDVEWFRDKDGYEILPETPAIPGKWKSVLSDPGDPLRIKRRGGELEPYRPVQKNNFLFKEFANAAVTPTGAFGFVKKYGPLTLAGLDVDGYEGVGLLIEHAAAMRNFLAYAEGDKDALIRTATVDPRGVRLANATARLAVDMKSRTLKLRLSPESLLDALWVQLGQALAGGASIKQCGYCKQWFTGRKRSDVIFCCKAHSVRFHSLERTRAKHHA